MFTTFANTTCLEFSFPDSDGFSQQNCDASPSALLTQTQLRSISVQRFEPRLQTPGPIVARADPNGESGMVVGAVNDLATEVQLRTGDQLLSTHVPSQVLEYGEISFRLLAIESPGDFTSLVILDELGEIIAAVPRQDIPQL